MYLVAVERYFLAFEKCGAGNVALFATPGSAPQGILSMSYPEFFFCKIVGRYQ